MLVCLHLRPDITAFLDLRRHHQPQQMEVAGGLLCLHRTQHWLFYPKISWKILKANPFKSRTRSWCLTKCSLHHAPHSTKWHRKRVLPTIQPFPWFAAFKKKIFKVDIFCFNATRNREFLMYKCGSLRISLHSYKNLMFDRFFERLSRRNSFFMFWKSFKFS